jgi:hypothetical protein
MATGDILKESGLVVDTFTIKASGDVLKGTLYCDDGSGGGLVIVTAALAVANKVVMALEDRVYATDTTNGHAHTVPCVTRGYVIATKVSGSGLAAKGNKLMISGTSGQVGKFVKGAVSQANTFATATDQTAIDTNAAVIGYATKTSTDAEVVQEMYLGAP